MAFGHLGAYGPKPHFFCPFLPIFAHFLPIFAHFFAHFFAFLGSGDQSIRGPLTKLFSFGLSIMEKMAVVKIVTEEDGGGGGRTENSFLRY